MIRTDSLTAFLATALLVAACAAPAATPAPSPTPSATPAPTASPTPPPTPSPTPRPTPSPSPSATTTASPGSGSTPTISIPGYTIASAPDIEEAFRLIADAGVGDANPLGYLAAAKATGSDGFAGFVLFGFTTEPSDEAFFAIIRGGAAAAGVQAERGLDGQGFVAYGPSTSVAFTVLGESAGKRIYLMVIGDDRAVVEEVAFGVMDSMRR